MASREPSLENLEARILAIIAREAQDCDIASLSTESRFADLTIDSLDAVNIAFALEDEWGLDFDPNEVRELETVGDLVQRIRDLIPASQAA